MSASSYSKLFTIEKFLTEDPLLLEGFLYLGKHDIVPKKELATHLRNTLVNYKRDFAVLRIFIYREIYSTSSLDQLFREDSLNCVVIQQYLREAGEDWLKKALVIPLKAILTCKYSAEINPLFLTKRDKLKSNLKTLTKMTSSILENVWCSFEEIPVEILRTCKYLFNTSNERFNGSGYFSLSSFLFLRFICPYITTIEIPKSSSSCVKRNLILMIKIIQR